MPYEPEPFVVGRSPFPRPDELTAPPVVRDEAEDEPREDEMLAASPPEHTWLGKGLVWTLYTSVVIAIVRFCFMMADPDTLMFGEDSTLGRRMGAILPIALFMIGLQLWTARAIRDFRLTGLGPAMLLLAMLAFSAGWVVLHSGSLLYVSLAAVLVAFCAAWAAYLLARFRDFS